jgi:hypothetical protein
MRNRKGVVAFVAISSLLLCRAHSQAFGNNIPGTSITEGQAIGIVVGSAAAIAVVTIVLVHNAHPTLKGCVTSGPDGLFQQNEGDQKTYALAGMTAGVKAGDTVKVQGKKVKAQKKSHGNQEFTVSKFSRDYGPCKATAPQASAPPGASPPNSGQ